MSRAMRRGPKALPKLLKALTLSLAVLIVLAAGATLWLLSSLPRFDGELHLAGLAQEVRVRRDANAIPHIAAKSANDAYFALGFVHAQDRLWQMDLERRVAQGRLSELFGEQALATDRFMRTLGLYPRAAAGAEALAPEVRAALRAYAAGVNAYLENRRGALPVEFLLLRYEPEPWRPVDSLVWGRLMAARLSGNWRDELLRARLARRLDPRQIAALWPPYPGDAPVILRNLARNLETGAARAPFDALWASLPRDPAPASESNSWVIDGRLSASGKPILANDPHLGYRAPGHWYFARLTAPGLDVAGATAPGVPFTLLGHNDRIAWGLTTTSSDTEDLFIEKLDPADPNRYLTPEGSKPFDTRIEHIRVRDKADIEFTVRESRHGPILSDLPGNTAEAVETGFVLALSSTALLPEDRTAEAVYRLNRAGDWRQFVAALTCFSAPQQNLVYADREGNIGFYAPARVPIRSKGEGYMPAPGWSGEYDWRGFIPFDSLPHRLNPPSGNFITANHKVVDSDYPYFLSRDWEDPYRARRVRERLDESRRHSLATTASIQGDFVSIMAREILPLLLAAQADAADGRAREVRERLRQWDFAMDRADPEPLIFTAWLRELNRLVYADELGPMFADYRRLRPRFIESVLRDRREWCDDIRTETVESCASRIEMALGQALDKLARRHGSDWRGWRWGEAHKATFRHPVLTHIPLLAALADIEIPVNGGDYTLNRASLPIAGEGAPFAAIHGPGLRAIYDLSDLANSAFMASTGQSGNPFSRHYRDFTERWRDLDYLTIDNKDKGEEDLGVLILRPDRRDGEP
jgi:penicillin amidase